MCAPGVVSIQTQLEQHVSIGRVMKHMQVLQPRLQRSLP